MKRGMVQYKSKKCPCGKPVSAHSEPEYQRHLHPEVRFVSIADRLAEAAARA
jgi:hypothetical protein